MEQVEHKNEDKMRVHKGKGIVALISVLDQIFAHNRVKEIKKELTNLNKGDEITWGDVRHIFKEHEDWAVSMGPESGSKLAFDTIWQFT